VDGAPHLPADLDRFFERRPRRRGHAAKLAQEHWARRSRSDAPPTPSACGGSRSPAPARLPLWVGVCLILQHPSAEGCQHPVDDLNRPFRR